MKKIAIFTLALSLTGCSYFTKRAKRDVLSGVSNELDLLIVNRSADCDNFLSHLKGLKEKVAAELEKVK